MVMLHIELYKMKRDQETSCQLGSYLFFLPSHSLLIKAKLDYNFKNLTRRECL